eukprot:scaffold58854_cov33-Prasinocladus_malaysianus.AAC.2
MNEIKPRSLLATSGPVFAKTPTSRRFGFNLAVVVLSQIMTNDATTCCRRMSDSVCPAASFATAGHI